MSNLSLEQISIPIVIFFLLIYFFPTVIAYSRSKSNTLAIFMLNLFLGWSFIGWVVALIWACTKDKETQQFIVNNNSYSDNKIAIPNFPQPIRQKTDNDSIEKNISNHNPKNLIKQNTNNTHLEKIQNLQNLKNLFDEGILTQEEFDQEKKQILG